MPHTILNSGVVAVATATLGRRQPNASRCTGPGSALIDGCAQIRLFCRYQQRAGI